MRSPGAQDRIAALLASAAAALLALGAGEATALEIPAAPAGRVSDYAGLLSAAAAERIERRIAAHEGESSDQIAVAIFRSLEGESLEDFSIRLAERWKIGTAEHDNGVILLIFVDDRRTRLEVGYGLEGRLTDALSDRILRQVLAPRFRAGDFDGGVEAAVEAIIGTIRGEYTAAAPPPSAAARRSPLGPLAAVGNILFFIVLALLFFFAPSWFWVMVLGSFLGGGGRGWSGGRRGGFGGFGGGGFGGGGFGGGGGGFGGGGASGRW